MLLDAIEKETSHTDERERQYDLNPISVENERLENLEMKVEKIYNELNELRNAFIEFKKQFE
jgi:predicted RNase H-like nuclease (RuvC/YqgF family)